MNWGTPITWEEYLFFEFAQEHPFAAGAIVAAVIFMAALGLALQVRECRECGRRLQRRGRARFCPFHDDGSPYP
jgi:hypothetical protein